MRQPNYDKFPTVPVPNSHDQACVGWDAIAQTLAAQTAGRDKTVVVIDCYSGVHEQAITESLAAALQPSLCVNAAEQLKDADAIDALCGPFLGGDDPVFGFLCGLHLDQFIDAGKADALRSQIAAVKQGVVLVVGTGAANLHDGDILIVADMPRWEGQNRQRRNEVSNLGVSNADLKASMQYKRSFFIDWRVGDRWKKPLLERMDHLLDTTDAATPKLAIGDAIRRGYEACTQRPFRVVPFFDPGPWGGQWMKHHCELDDGPPNYAWCFDGVPEENSLLLDIGGVRVETPAQNLVYRHPRGLLGDAVHARFGAEFPIRFDFLDTMDGGHLSFQVHPLTEYIQEHFGMHYTQDESYYMLDAEEDAVVYLGVKDDVDPDAMIAELKEAQTGTVPFDADKHANAFPAKKHDHFLIPAGTVHCSGKNSMVLEISATPYIFTFKMWDWGRLGLDGLPRPINVERGAQNIDWSRNTAFCEKHLVNAVEEVARGEGFREERTGLHEREFIETRRHWFTRTVEHDTGGVEQGGVHVLNLVEGEEAIVESPTNAFEPFIVHYAETFIIPAAVGRYTIRPHGESEGKEIATIKAYVRHRA